MSIEIVKSIRDAEEKAEDMIKQALAQGRDRVKAAEEESLAEKAEAIRKAREEAKTLLSQAEKEAMAEVEAMRKENQIEGERIRSAAARQMGKAESLIMGRIVNNHGHH